MKIRTQAFKRFHKRRANRRIELIFKRKLGHITPEMWLNLIEKNKPLRLLYEKDDD